MSYLSITLRIFPVCLLCFSASWAQGVSTHNIPQELEFSAQQYKTPEISDRRIDADHFSYRMKHLTYLLAELNKKDTSEFDKLALSDADHPRANPFSDNLISVDQRILYLGNLFSQLINLQKRSREMDFEELSARLRVLDYKAHYYSPGAHTSSRLASAISPYSIQITPSTYDFGTIEVGGTTPPLTVTLSNNSLVPITLSDYYPRISISDGFEITQSTCNDIVAAGDSCEVNVIFEPVSVGDFDSYLSFRFDEINDFFFVDLSGKAESDDTYLIGLTPSTYDFGTIEVGGTTPPLTVTLSNNSLVPITLSDYYPRISISDGFEITQSTCNDFVAAGDSCEVNVIFEPVSVGDFDSYLSFRFDEINDFFFVDLSGKAESDDTYLIGLTPSTYDFGTIEVGGTTPPLTVTLSNNSLVPITLSDYYPRISISDGFEITQSTCNDFVAAGDSCEVNVIFEPVSVGDFDSYLFFRFDEINDFFFVDLSGKGSNNSYHTLTVNVSGPGAVTSTTAGIDCPSDCETSVPDGTEVTLNPIPSGGAEFSGWSGACTGTADCTITVYSQLYVTASFNQNDPNNPEGTETFYLGGNNDQILITGNPNIDTRYLDFGGNDIVTISTTPAGPITFVDRQDTVVNLPVGLQIDAVAFASDGVRFTIANQSVTLLGSVGDFSFVFAGFEQVPSAGIRRTYAETASAFGAFIPPAGDGPVFGSVVGTIANDGSIVP